MEPITQAEFNDAVSYGKRGGAPLSPVVQEALSLQPGTGFKTPCTWKHAPNCSGINIVKSAGVRHGIRDIGARCKEGTLYVFRPV